MAVYETGAASSVTDLLDKLRIFATANGWTQNFFGTRTTGSGQALQLTKGAMACTFIADTSAGTSADPGNYFGAYQHDTYNAGNGTENQANKSLQCLANGMTGPYVAYHFMTGSEGGSDYLYVVVEVTSGTYKHAGVGKLVGMGALTNGHFAFGCRWGYGSTPISDPLAAYHAWPFDSGESGFRGGPATQVRADCDGVTPRWYDFSSGVSYGNRAGGGVRAVGSALGTLRGTVYGPTLYGASAITGRTTLVPCMIYGERTSNLASILGYAPGMRWVKLDYIAPGDILTLGADQWKVFPVIRKNGSAGQVNSGLYGYAYKVN